MSGFQRNRDRIVFSGPDIFDSYGGQDIYRRLAVKTSGVWHSTRLFKCNWIMLAIVSSYSKIKSRKT